MELRPLQSCSLSTIPRTAFIDNHPFLQHHVHFLKLPTPNNVYPNAINLKPLSFRFRAQASATTKSAVEAIPNNVDSKDENLIFVAGATGKVGSRTVRELLKLGFRVRAGVRSVQRAESLVESVKQMKLDEGTQPMEKLDIVQCDLEKQDQIGPALGNASVVICCIGASEKEVFDVTGPYRIDYQATKNLIDAATVAKVNQFILLTSLGTNKVGFPAAILNLFWGVLIWKRKAEEALLASGIPYTIVRPGGMERPTDSYKETHNITLSMEDTLFGGQVSNLQVAELMACMAKNCSLSYCKVVEVVAETTAPLTPMEELLAKIPSQRAGGAPVKGPGVADGPKPVISKSVGSETPMTSTVKEPAEAKPTVTSALSPYIMYEDLKPPTSPTPTTPGNTTKAGVVETISATTNSAPPPSVEINSEPSNIVMEKEAIQTEVKKPSPLSPYICYDDLKPPVSPTPKAPTGQKEDNVNNNVIEAVPKPTAIATASSEASKVSAEVAATDDKPKSSPVRVSLSPYAAYEDLKPPTSPSPRSPTVSPPSTSPANGSKAEAPLGSSTEQPTADESAVDKQLHTAPKLMSLSPFPMYEDLKPPTSPTPSPRKL